MPDTDRVRERHWLEPWALGLVVAVGLVLPLWRAAPASTWRDDLSVIRGMGLIPLGAEGIVSGILAQLFALVPLGGRLLRAASVSAVCLSCSMALVLLLTTQLLESGFSRAAARSPSARGVVLASGAAVMVGLCSSWQWEGTVAGGATVSACLALSVLSQAQLGLFDARRGVCLGALLGLGILESRATGVAAGLAAVSSLALDRSRVSSRALGALVVAGVLTVAITALPAALRVGSGGAASDFSYWWIEIQTAGARTATRAPQAWEIWFDDLGSIPCVLALVGLLGAAWNPISRRIALPMTVFLLIDMLSPSQAIGMQLDESVSGLRLVALAGLAALSAAGVATLIRCAEWATLPYARQASVLLLIFYSMLAGSAAEGSERVARERALSAAEAWTDEALATLPPRSLLLVRSEKAYLRLWAARIAHGDRPDILIVPLQLVGVGATAKRLIDSEPALSAVVRDLALEGRPTEFALSTLADTRPLYVELDPSWDKRLFQHALPAGLWTRFSPHAVGSSDRVLTLAPALAPLDRVAVMALRNSGRDRATLAVLERTALDQLAVLRALRDVRGEAMLVQWLAKLTQEPSLSGASLHRAVPRNPAESR